MTPRTVATKVKQVLKWLWARWYLAIALLLLVLWLGVLVAYRLGAEGISVRSRSGQTVNLDFGRQHDHTWVAVGPGVGLELDAYNKQLHGTIARVKPGIPGLCWVCGDNVPAGGLAMVKYRQGDWYFKAPQDYRNNSEATRGRRPASRAYILTIAYNVATNERVIVAADATVEAQATELRNRGLTASVANLLTLDPAWHVLSMQREGCVIFNAAFVVLALLLALIAVPVELLRARWRRQAERRRIAPAIVRRN